MRIGLDIDGVLSDFDRHFLRYLKIKDKSIFRDYNDERISKNFHRIEKDKNFWLTIPSLIRGEELDFYPNVYVTKRNISNNITLQWLSKHNFPKAPLHSIGLNASKVNYLKDKVDFYIEDSYENYLELNRAGIDCYLLTKTYNEQFKVSKRINTINEILNFV